LLVAILGAPSSGSAQVAEDSTLKPVDGLLIVGAAALNFAPDLFNFKPGPPECLPCDPASVPFFDRWAIAEPRKTWDHMSTALLLGLTAVTTLDPARREPNRIVQLAVLVESASVAAGLTHFLKAATARNRPVLYTGAALDLADPAESRLSWPSGHTSTAFAVATSYVLSMSRVDDPAPKGLQIGVMAAAAMVGGLRVAAGRHFPSDVVSGAAVGIGTAFVVHEIRF
jgi:membrane-associated phospholipid phosphatase